MVQKHQNRRKKLHDREQFYRDAATKRYDYEQLSRKYGVSVVWVKTLLKRGGKQ